ncbi:MAG: response regulator [Candidatus Acidiferrales bacterium]
MAHVRVDPQGLVFSSTAGRFEGSIRKWRGNDAVDCPIRILLADDNYRVRPMLSKIISEADPRWEVCAEVANGQAAVEMAAELKPDLVILDFAMPILDGISAGRQIRAILPDVPLLLYTFISSARIEQVAKEAGIHAVIEKADFRKLVEEIRKLVAGS